MSTRIFLVAGLATVSACNQYSYPESPTRPASGVNEQLFSESAGLFRGGATVTITDLKCQGPDYVLTVHYDQSFEEVQHFSLQYQVSRPSPSTLPVFTQPTGIMALGRATPAGDVNLVIPGSQVIRDSSDILVRLKLSTPTVLEYTSGVELIHLDSLCPTS